MVVRAGFELRITGFKVCCPNHLATMPLKQPQYTKQPLLFPLQLKKFLSFENLYNLQFRAQRNPGGEIYPHPLVYPCISNC